MRKLRGDWVLVKPIIEEKTKGGVFLPDSAKEGSMLAEVIAVGDGRKREELYVSGESTVVDGKERPLVKRRFVRIPVEVPVGATVVIPRWAGYEVKLGDEQCLLVREYQCLAVVGSKDG